MFSQSIMNACVLKSNGTYIHVSHLRKGDYVMDRHGKASMVLSVKQRRTLQGTDAMSMKHPLWYDQMICSTDTQLLAWKNEWVSYESLGRYLMVPTTYDWDMQDNFTFKADTCSIVPSYEIGYLFGAFLRVGSINKYRGIVFHCPGNKHFFVQTILAHGATVFPNAKSKLFPRSNGNYDVCLSGADSIFETFEEFATPTTYYKCPRMFYCKDKEYVRGLAAGLIESSMFVKTAPSHPHVLEMMYWAGLTSQRTLHYSVVMRDTFACYKPFVLPCSKYSVDFRPLYDVETESGTYIANNTIVKCNN